MSEINTGTINVNYPVPGVNNSSQGFRDNFASIKTNLDAAGSEISELQTKTIVKSAINGVTLNNDMNNTVISNAQTLRFRASTFNLGSNLSGNVSVDLSKGDVHYGTMTDNVTLSFTKWAPAGTRSSVHVILTVNSSTTKQIILPASVQSGLKTLENYTGSSTITLRGSLGSDTQSTVHYIFSTTDCGVTIEVESVNRPRKTTQIMTDVPATSVGSAGDRAGYIAADATYMYVCTGTYNGSTAIWKRISLTAW
jgi:hypothetical protein